MTDRVVERLRAAQGVIGLCKTYGRERLESACRRTWVAGLGRSATASAQLNAPAERRNPAVELTR